MPQFLLIILLGLCLPNLLLSWLVMLVVRAAWGATLTAQQGVFIVRLKADSWLSRMWAGRWLGFCMGHGVIVAADAGDSTLTHELIHTRQIQGDCIAHAVPAAFVGIATHWAVGLLYLLAAPLLAYVSSGLVAVLRGKRFYTDNDREQAARRLSS